MANGQRITVHAGGLTCGAEDVVVYLAANRPALRREGYGLHCLDVSGAGGGDSLGDVMPPPGAGADDLAFAGDALARRFAPDRKVGEEGFILSATDLAGPLSELLIGRFHPYARQRAAVLHRALGQPVDRLVMVVQPYEVLFHTCWMMLALDRRIDPFEDYASVLWQFRSGWADLGQALVEELEVRELVVHAPPFSPAEMVRLMLPGVNLRQATTPLPKARVTPSAVAMAQRCIAQGTRLQPGQRDRLVAFHARQPQIAADYGFTDRELAELQDRYLSDLDRMQRELGAELVGVPQPALA